MAKKTTASAPSKKASKQAKPAESKPSKSKKAVTPKKAASKRAKSAKDEDDEKPEKKPKAKSETKASAKVATKSKSKAKSKAKDDAPSKSKTKGKAKDKPKSKEKAKAKQIVAAKAEEPTSPLVASAAKAKAKPKKSKKDDGPAKRAKAMKTGDEAKPKQVAKAGKPEQKNKSAARSALTEKPAKAKPAQPKREAAKRVVKSTDGQVKPASKKAATQSASSPTDAARPADPKKASRTIAETRLREPGRRGQIASEKARFELGEHSRVLQEELGTLPPGYGLTIVRGWIRDPRHVVMVWDVNDPQMVARAEAAGWQTLAIRVLNEGGGVIADVPVGSRAGTYHLEIPPGYTIKLALGLRRPDGFFETLALSGPVRVPPEQPAPEGGEFVTLALPEHLDRRLLVTSEPPPRPGHRPPSRLSPARRLAGRVDLARQVVQEGEWSMLFGDVLDRLDERLRRAASEAPISWLELTKRGPEAMIAHQEGADDAGIGPESAGGPSSLEMLRAKGPSSEEIAKRGAPSSDSLVRKNAPSSPGGHPFGK